MVVSGDEELFRSFFLRHPHPLAIFDTDGLVVEINDGAVHALGHDLGKGVRIAERVHADDRTAFEEAWARLSAGTEPSHFTCRLRATGGEWRHFAWNARRSPDRPEIHASLTPERDPQAMKLMKLESQLLRTILDNVDIAVYAMDKDGTYLYNDGKGTRHDGDAPVLVGKNMFALFGDAVTPTIKNALAGIAGEELSTYGSNFWQNWYVPVQDEEGLPNGMAGLSLNISEMHRAKLELEQKIELIARQEEVIRNLETPIIQVWDKVLTLPMVGTVDSRRASRVMDDLLSAVTRTQAQFAILDLTGVDVVDSATANHLLAMIRAIRLLGAEGIITGIRPNVARTIVTLELDLGSILTCGNLRQGLALAIRLMSSSNR